MTKAVDKVAAFYAWRGGNVSYPQDGACDLEVDITGNPLLRVKIIEDWKHTEDGFEIPFQDESSGEVLFCLVDRDRIIVFPHASIEEGWRTVPINLR